MRRSAIERLRVTRARPLPGKFEREPELQIAGAPAPRLPPKHLSRRHIDPCWKVFPDAVMLGIAQELVRMPHVRIHKTSYRSKLLVFGACPGFARVRTIRIVQRVIRREPHTRNNEPYHRQKLSTRRTLVAVRASNEFDATGPACPICIEPFLFCRHRQILHDTPPLSQPFPSVQLKLGHYRAVSREQPRPRAVPPERHRLQPIIAGGTHRETLRPLYGRRVTALVEHSDRSVPPEVQAAHHRIAARELLTLHVRHQCLQSAQVFMLFSPHPA